VIRSVLYLQPRRGDAGAVVDFYRRHRVLEHAVEQDGCFGAELQLATNGSGDVLVTALWRDRHAYQGWLDNPVRSTHAEELGRLVATFDAGVSGETYEIVIDVEPRG
jgi:heme-degrading monooxygenase HmoA